MPADRRLTPAQLRAAAEWARTFAEEQPAIKSIAYLDGVADGLLFAASGAPEAGFTEAERAGLLAAIRTAAPTTCRARHSAALHDGIGLIDEVLDDLPRAVQAVALGAAVVMVLGAWAVEGVGHWGYSAVPDRGCDWWDALPSVSA